MSAGADVAMVTSALYREGPGVMRTFIDGLSLFLDRHHMQTIQDLQTKRPLEFGSEQERREPRASSNGSTIACRFTVMI